MPSGALVVSDHSRHAGEEELSPGLPVLTTNACPPNRRRARGVRSSGLVPLPRLGAFVVADAVCRCMHLLPLFASAAHHSLHSGWPSLVVPPLVVSSPSSLVHAYMQYPYSLLSRDLSRKEQRDGVAAKYEYPDTSQSRFHKLHVRNRDFTTAVDRCEPTKAKEPVLHPQRCAPPTCRPQGTRAHAWSCGLRQAIHIFSSDTEHDAAPWCVFHFCSRRCG